MRKQPDTEEQHGFTMIPHWYLRDFITHSSDTGFKIIGFLLDQTRGWHKKSDQTTLTHIAKRIGKSRSTVSRNLQSLINSGYLVAYTKQGVLDTPAKRKFSGIRQMPIYFMIPEKLVANRDKPAHFKQEHGALRDKVMSHSKPSKRGKMPHNIIKERNKESRQTPAKEGGRRCPNCGKPADEMDRAYIRWKFKIDSDLCRECCKLTHKQP